MAGNLFDVFVVGATDPSAAGETRLAAALSAKHGVPLATVAKAISAKNLRAGQSLDQAQAQALVRHLQSIGAVTVIRPVAGARPGAASPSPGGRVTGSQQVVSTPAPGAGWPGGPSALPSESAAMGAQFAPLASPAAQGGGPDPFRPNRASAPDIAARPRTPPVASPRPSPSGLAMDNASPGPKLELARSDRSQSGGPSDDELMPPRSRTNVAAGSLREMGMAGSSGVAMDEDPKNLNLVRCVQHGLYYDKTKASGCRKCMSPAREVAAKMTAESVPVRMGDMRQKPAKRAFLGLVFALVLGFLPAVYYCFGPGAADVRKVRTEQELLSRQPGTEEILKRFDELDGQVPDLHEQATRNVAIVWVAVTSVCLFGWYKIT
jgi:hypothetical protein